MAAIPTTGYLKANAGADTPLTLYVRDEEGRRDFTQAPVPLLQMAIRRPFASQPIAIIPATGDALGKVTTTITAADVQKTIYPGLYSYRLTADGVQVQSGVLEVAA